MNLKLSRLTTFIQKRSTPILEKTLNPTLSFALVEADSSPVAIMVHGDTPPTDSDWDKSIEFLIHVINDFDCKRCFVLIPGQNPPAPEQSKRMVESVKNNVPEKLIRTAVLNPKSNASTKLASENFSVLHHKIRPSEKLSLKFFTSEEEALHHILIDPNSKEAKKILTTITYLSDKTKKKRRR